MLKSSSLLSRRLRLKAVHFLRRYPPSLRSLAAAMLLTMGVSTLVEISELKPRLDSIALSFGYRMRGTIAPPKDVVIVSLDDDSNGKLGLPSYRTWPRDAIGRLITAIKELGAEAIILDVLFKSPGFSPEEDAALKEALSSTKAVIGTARDPVMYPPASVPYRPEDDPLPELSRAAGGVVSVVLWTGRSFDGAVRFISERKGADYLRVPLLTLLKPGSPARQNPPDIGDFINFYGPTGTIPVIPADQILTPPKERRPDLKGMTVFVGIAEPKGRKAFVPAIGSPSDAPVDRFSVPVSSLPMFGVEIHATIFSNLREASWMTRLVGDSYEISAVLVCTLLVNWLVCFVTGARRLLVAAASAALWCFGFHTCFARGVYLCGASQALVAVPLCAVLFTFIDYLKLRRAVTRIETTMSKASRL